MGQRPSARSTVQRPSAPAFGGYRRGADARAESARGRASLQSAPPRAPGPSVGGTRSFGGGVGGDRPSGGGGGPPAGGGGRPRRRRPVRPRRRCRAAPMKTKADAARRSAGSLAHDETMGEWTGAIGDARCGSAVLRWASRRLWPRPVAPAMSSGMQISKPPIQIVPVFFPRDPIHSCRCIPLEPGIGGPQQIDAHMVQKRGEPLLLPQPCGCPYALHTCGHAVPARCPERAWLARLSLGPAPSLHRLRRRSPVIVRRLPRYYGRI
jgi:hypothetical protein